jgi:hypothetical protein
MASQARNFRRISLQERSGPSIWERKPQKVLEGEKEPFSGVFVEVIG